ncbi:MAG: ABC transporter substrate-binding protein [Patescibacteria group bacterium]|jgi:NitT/TauT family transport system substrate-binding protein
MKNKKVIRLAFFLTIILVILIVVSFIFKNKEKNNVEDEQLEKVRVQAGWILNAEFANICSAIKEGYYEEEGLDVELIPGGPTGASFVIATNALVQDKNIDIAIDGDIIPLLRGVTNEREEEKIRAKIFSVFWRENPFGFIVRKDSGINNFYDLVNNRKNDGSKYKIGVTADSVAQFAIANHVGVPVDDLNLSTVGFDASPFLLNQVDALASYWTTQAYEVEKAGIDYNFLSFGDIPGFSQPSMVAIARDETIREKPEMLEKWLRATIKGSKFSISNPEKAAEYVLSDVCGGKILDIDQELWMMKKSIPLFGDDNIGSVDIEQILNFSKAYYDLGQIPSIPSENDIIDLSVLNKINSKD